MTRTGGSMMEGGSPLSGHAKMTATSGERRRRGGGQGPELLLAEGAGVEAGTAEGAGAEASEGTEEVREAAVETGDNQGVREVEVETGDNLLLQREEEVLREVERGDKIGDTDPGADLLTDGDTDE